LAKFFKKRRLKTDPRLLGGYGKLWITLHRKAMHRVEFRQLAETQVQGTRVDLLSLSNAGRIISRDELLSKVWKCQQTMTTRTVDQTISSLRRKLGDDAESPRYLITVYGVGYTLRAFTS